MKKAITIMCTIGMSLFAGCNDGLDHPEIDHPEIGCSDQIVGNYKGMKIHKITNDNMPINLYVLVKEDGTVPEQHTIYSTGGKAPVTVPCVVVDGKKYILAPEQPENPFVKLGET